MKQLVVYLLLDLRRRQLGVRSFVSLLETVIIDALGQYGLEAGRRPEAPGVYVGGAALSSRVQIGESEPGSPILYPDHDYNVSSKNINEHFPGSEEMYVVARTSEPGGMKRPEVLRALQDFQVHMLADPDMGGSKGIPDLVKQVNQILHNDDPRWAVIPDESSYVGGLMFAFMASSPIPGALKEFVDTDDQTANLVFFYKDH